MLTSHIQQWDRKCICVCVFVDIWTHAQQNPFEHPAFVVLFARRLRIMRKHLKDEIFRNCGRDLLRSSYNYPADQEGL